MSSVHKLPGKPSWVCFFRDRHGRRRAKSTLTDSKARAEIICREIQSLENRAGAGRLNQQNARRILEDRLEEILADDGASFDRSTIRKFFTGWLEGKAVGGSAASTVARYRTIVELLFASLGSRADRPLAQLSSADVTQFLAARLKGGASPSTAVLDVTVLRAALNRARRQGLVASNAAEAVDLPKVNPVARDVFTLAEVGRLLSASTGEWPTLILLAFYTGARLGDCAMMRWADWDRVQNVLRFHQMKTGASVVMPVHPALARHLEQLGPCDRPQDFFLPVMGIAKAGGGHGLSNQFRRIMFEAKVSMVRVKGGGNREVATKSFHSFRHTFTSALANAGVSEEVRKKLTGHRSKTDVHQTYTHHEVEVLRKAVALLPDISQ
jgi:integrase